jgi:hypothetical protein
MLGVVPEGLVESLDRHYSYYYTQGTRLEIEIEKNGCFRHLRF